MIDCDEVKLALSDAATVFIPKSQSRRSRTAMTVAEDDWGFHGMGVLKLLGNPFKNGWLTTK